MGVIIIDPINSLLEEIVPNINKVERAKQIIFE